MYPSFDSPTKTKSETTPLPHLLCITILERSNREREEFLQSQKFPFLETLPINFPNL